MEMLVMKFDKYATKPLYEQLYDKIRTDIQMGKLAVGTKLPSKRKLGEFLKISQTTIELAYGQLVAEGFISAIPRSGYYVQAIEELAYVELEEETEQVFVEEQEIFTQDFSPGLIDTENFPFTQWRKQAKQVIDENMQELLLLGHPHGDLILREEIARYLYHSRGVNCTPEQIIIGSGTEQLMPLVIRILGHEAIYGIEDPGYPLTHHVFDHNNRNTIPIPVDEEGMNIAILQRSAATVAYVTPSHQFPTGTVLSAARRTALLNWASAAPERFIIEDDYDSEFRYEGRPIPSLQGMDQADRVIYLSTFSKSLMPSLRIAYMVLPKRLLKRYQNAFIHYSSTVPRLDQHILANFMKEGQFSRHLNRMRTIYRKKLDLLIQVLQQYEPTISYSGEVAGMHLTVTIHQQLPPDYFMNLANQASIRVFSLDTYRSTTYTGYPTFVLGFGGFKDQAIEEAVHALMKAWKIPLSSSVRQVFRNNEMK